MTIRRALHDAEAVGPQFWADRIADLE